MKRHIAGFFQDRQLNFLVGINIVILFAATWLSHGGQDERFRGWGFEDAAWYVAHETLLGAPPQRHQGSVFALHHETQLREGPQYDLNAALMQRYRDAATSADAMRAFVDER